MRALGMVRADSQSVQKGLQHLPRPRVLVDLVFSTSYLWEPKKYKNITNDLITTTLREEEFIQAFRMSNKTLSLNHME